MNLEPKRLFDEQVAGLMADDIPAEYDVDYSKAKPNRFAGRDTAKTVKQNADAAATFRADSHATSSP